MAVQKVTGVFSSPKTDAEKNEILDKANIHRNSATVIRDANGKVVQIEVNLPDTASQTAFDKISANPGVATAISEDLIPGTDGFAGDQASYDTLIAKVTTTVNDEYQTVIEDNLDGTMTFSPHANYQFMEYALMSNNYLRYPNESKIEFKFQFRKLGGGTIVQLSASNGGRVQRIYINSNGTARGLFGMPTMPFINDTDPHTVEIVHTATNMSVVLDSVTVWSLTLPSSSESLDISMKIAGSSLDEGITVDFLRWTENV